jgi:RNA polymerase sigma-70 factor (ECF subfamily)
MQQTLTYKQPPVTTHTDESLAERLQRGDSCALSALFDRHQEGLYRFLLRWSGSVEEAEDLVQETFVRVYASISTYSPSRPFRPWIYTIAKHLAWKRLRHRRSVACVSLDEAPELRELLPDASQGPEDVVYLRAEVALIRQAVQRLPEDQRVVFILHHYNGLSYEEIAEVCGCPIGTVKSRMHYALAYLRRRLSS